MVQLDSQLQESYNQMLLSGQSLRLVQKSWECVVNYLPADSAGSFDLAISKNYTRLATLFATFNQADPADNSGLNKIVNSHYFPSSHKEDAAFHLAFGSRRIPDNDAVGTSEHWYRLQRALGVYDSLAHSLGVDEDSYTSDCYLGGIDLEALPMVSASGENLSTGQTIFLKCRNFGSAPADVPRRCTLCAHFESIISISDTVTELFT